MVAVLSQRYSSDQDAPADDNEELVLLSGSSAVSSSMKTLVTFSGNHLDAARQPSSQV